MTTQEICTVLDEIISAMDQVFNKDVPSHEKYLATLRPLLARLPAACYADITEPEIKIRVDTIWRRSFAKHQGMRSKKRIATCVLLGSIRIDARLAMVKHSFYVDYKSQKTNATILFSAFEILNHKLLKPIIDAIAQNGMLSQYLENKRGKTKKKCMEQNIFEHIETVLSRAISRATATSSMVKIREMQSFAKCLIEYLSAYNIQHGFTASITELIDFRKRISKKRKIVCNAKNPEQETKKLQIALPVQPVLFSQLSMDVDQHQSNQILLAEDLLIGNQKPIFFSKEFDLDTINWSIFGLVTEASEGLISDTSASASTLEFKI